MSIFAGVLALVFLALLIIVAIKANRLQKLVAQRDAEVASAKEESQRARQSYEAETARVYSEGQTAVAEAQKLIDQETAEAKQESDRIRQHYQAEARKIQEAADALVSQKTAEVESLRKYERLRDAEAQTQTQLSEAIKEATALRQQAEALMAQAQEAAADERLAAQEKVKDIHEQADARLDQAIRDAGRIMAQAEERAEKTGGDAYRALQDKELLEQAAEAIRNKIEGYGDRYLVPAHSVLDDLADKFGYDAAGQALKSARALPGRMIEQGEAATCDYVETIRRKTAIQFVIHAFNGEVDSILSEVASDNSGTLAQKIRDAFIIVNLNGQAFRNARILPAYLDARLAELDCAVRMREFVQRVRDEQRAERERIRDEQKAEEERQEEIRKAAQERALAVKEQEIKRAALEEAKQMLAQAHADDRARLEEKVQELNQEVAQANQKLFDATKVEEKISQRTRVGTIYIISNEGSFGPDVYKVGFTRRDPNVRVDELYDASVPFEFEILATITAENAPELEYKLHRQLLGKRLNKRNLHKEFFRVGLKEIREHIEKLATASWRATEAGRAAEWRESLEIESDPQAKEKWLNREQAAADERWRRRERRLANRRDQNASALANSDGVGTDAGEPVSSLDTAPA
jgi:F0F1-type ATP synthase membrane subunit b/b'